MSTLKVTNIQDTSGGNSSTTEQIKNGIAKAWVNFNGTGTVAIRAQYNVSSITDNGVGNYTVNFATAMVDANYSANASAENTVFSDHAIIGPGASSTALNVLSVRTDTGAFIDSTGLYVSVFR